MSSSTKAPPQTHSLGHHSLTTSRLHLRPTSLSDAPSIHLMRQDPEVMQWTSTPHAETHISQTLSWLETKVNASSTSTWNFAVLLKPQNEDEGEGSLIGLVGAVRGPEVGYMFRRDMHGRGYATEALRAFVGLFWQIVPSRDEVWGGLLSAANGGQGLASSGVLTDGTRQESEGQIENRGIDSGEKVKQKQPEVGGGQLSLLLGWDYVEAALDSENIGSARVLQKCGFSLWYSGKQDYTSATLGLRNTDYYRLARPGKTLKPHPARDAS